MNPTQIHSRALLVWLTISTWTARRYDKAVTRKVNNDYAASTDAGRYNKFLLPGDAQAYKTLIALAGSIRAEHYTKTLAWSDEGWRLLPTANYMEYTTWFRQQQSAYKSALDQFVADYPTMRAEAQIKLRGLYRDEDYPGVMDVRERFALDVQYSPVPAIGDFRVDLARDQIDAIEQSVNDRVEYAAQLAIKDAWDRLYQSVARISERLSDPEAIFRDSLIGNAREVCDALKRLNVTDDPALEEMRQHVERELTAHDPAVLRDTPRVRRAVAEKADAILSTMRDLYGSNGAAA